MTTRSEYSDKIHIKDLVVRCIIGVDQEERRDKRELVINITLHVYLGRACTSDQLNDTVDYRQLVDKIIFMAENSKFHLIESLAEKVAEICLMESLVRMVQVRIEKPSTMPSIKSAEVEITRERK